MSFIRKKLNQSEAAFDKGKLRLKDALGVFDPVIIFPYRGYGTGQEFYLNGRILEKERMVHGDEEHSNSLWNNMRKIWKRYESDEIPGVALEAEMKGITATTESDEEGFFKFVFKVPPEKKLADGWHEATLRIANMPFDLHYEENATAMIRICNQQDCFGIISDVDDTIIKSSAMSPFKKLQIMLTQNARHRAAFQGVEGLYNRLVANDRNPLFFVSGSSWNLYDMLVTFCEYQKIPKAPFFLRNLGLSPRQWLKQDTSEYKKAYISHIMHVFNRMSFILIGDSGQKDPEIYSEIYGEFPHQVKAIYIRHLKADRRKQELQQLAGATAVPFLLLNDSNDALEHAREMNWID